MLVSIHVHALAVKADAFHFETQALFEGRFAVQPDSAARSEDTLPGKRTHRRRAQQLRHLAMIERVAGGGGDLSVRGHLPARDLPNGAPESRLAPIIAARVQQPAGGLARSDGTGHGCPKS